MPLEKNMSKRPGTSSTSSSSRASEIEMVEEQTKPSSHELTIRKLKEMTARIESYNINTLEGGLE